jgi:transcriptional regulator with XRE-family HTH domain
MADLRRRFGLLVAANRRKRGLTQERLAEAADISVDMVTKIETGASGARFPVIERIATALEVDPAELFTTDIPSGAIKRGAFLEISTRLAGLSGSDLEWLAGVVEAALAPKGNEPPRSVSSKADSRSLRQTRRGSSR